MVRGEDDHRLVRAPGLLEVRDEPADLVVDLGDEPHVGGDHPLADLVAAEHLREAVLVVRGEHRVRVLALGLAPHRGQDVVPAVQVVVRGGDDVRPVRLDVAQVQAPRRVARLLDELDGAGRRVGGLAVRLLDAGRPVRVLHQPPGKDLPVVSLRGVGPLLPGVGPVVAEPPEVLLVVAWLLTHARMEAVEPVPDVESALGDARAHHALGVEAEPRHPLEVGLHVGLPAEHGLHPEGTQVVPEGHLADPERNAVPDRAVAADVAPGVEAHPARPADRRLHVGAIETHPARGERVDVRGADRRVPVAAEVVEPKLVRHDEQHVHRRRPAGASGTSGALRRRAPGPPSRAPPPPAASRARWACCTGPSRRPG